MSIKSENDGNLCGAGKALEKASQSPFILEIEKFNMTTNPELENVRWEQWITVMEYSNSTGL
jgi:hypothetical protein